MTKPVIYPLIYPSSELCWSSYQST